MILISTPIEELAIACWFSPIWPILPPNLAYTLLFPLQLLLVNLRYRDSHIPCAKLKSIFHCLGRSKESAEIRGPM
jgi:hypothetical protein